jgi:ribosomal protein S18 acetylase RimI-like enzyme
MASPQHAEPFGAIAYDLPPPGAGSTKHVALAPIPPGETLRLAASFAAIDPWARYAYQPARLAAFFSGSEPAAPRYALYADGDIVGVVGLKLDWLRGPFLQFLGILPGTQGQGLGSSVLTWIELEARRGGHHNLWVTASDFNARALGLYRRHGYEEAARLDGLVSDEHAEILLRKRLL